MQITKEINRDILNRLGLELLGGDSVCPSESDYYAMYWPDGTMRWLFNVNGCTPGFLAFYPAGNLRAKLGVILMRIIGFVGLMGLFSSKFENLKLDENGMLAKSLKECGANGWSLFAGTPGVDRKVVLALSSKGKITHYVKVPISEDSRKLIYDEIMAIRVLDLLRLEFVAIPEVTPLDDCAVLSNVNVKNSKVSSSLNNVHVKGLGEIYSRSCSKVSLISYIKMHSIDEKINEIYQASPLDLRMDVGKVRSIAQKMTDRLAELVTESGTKMISISFAHRDFTPWNSFVSDECLTLFDLELAKIDLSYGFDVFHFTYQTAIMEGRSLDAGVVKEEIVGILEKLSGEFSAGDFEMYKSLYFLYHVTDYLGKYIKQPIAHAQVFSQIDSWLEL